MSLLEIQSLPWPPYCRFAIIDTSNKCILHASDSLAWIKGQIVRLELNPTKIFIRL